MKIEIEDRDDLDLVRTVRDCIADRYEVLARRASGTNRQYARLEKACRETEDAIKAFEAAHRRPESERTNV